MNENILILLPVILPILAGAILPFLRLLQDKRKANLYVLIMIGITGILTLMAITKTNQSLFIIALTDQINILLRIDDMGRLFAIITVAMWLFSIVFCREYLEHEEHVTGYYSFMLLSLGSLLGACFSGNLITMYLFYEFVTLMSLPLVLHQRTKQAIHSGFKFLFYSIGGAFLALPGIFYMSRFCDSFDFVPGGVLNRNAVAGNEKLFLALVFLMLLGYGSKAGLFPFHGWLPTAHPVAPAPASALLSGNVTKVGVLAIIRVVYYVVGTDFLRGTWVQYAWLILSLITICLGSILAYQESNLKKRLAYSTISQVSYILFGLALMNQTALSGALLHVVFHSILKNALFLIAGALIFRTGLTKVNDYAGIGKRMPVTMWCYTIASLALIGIPPSSAFMSKWYLAQGALASGISVISWLGPVILLISALFTALYLLPLTMDGFFPGDREYKKVNEIREVSPFMTVPFIAFALFALILGMFPENLAFFIDQLANTIVF